ncbi:gamma-butyrobetaine dioxygenase-like [Antedon mediterranea]|uniref:gamma-butyrobetaine dioxygenase-like n=1 Tax=Antedon mediterranea TaxID=105859 RepID=UPI003AF48F1B
MITSYALSASRNIFFKLFKQAYCKEAAPPKQSMLYDASLPFFNQRKQFSQQVTEIKSSDDGHSVTVLWDDGHKMKYPYIWLRDNCRCASCYDSPVATRKFLINDLDLDAKFKLSEQNAGELMFYGTEGHQTIIQSSWLRDKTFGTIDMGPVFDTKLWGADLLSYLPKFKYEDVLTDDEILYRWMQSVKIHGIALINDAPTHDDEELRNLTERIGHIRQTFYGVVFGVKSKKDTYFPGYTSAELPLHTDYTFGANTPGIINFHGLKRAPSGGKSMFVDGFKIANDLKASDPDAHRLLCTGVMSFGLVGFDCGRHFDNRGQSKIINLDKDGQVGKISFSQHARKDGIAKIPMEQVRSFYKAVQKFASVIYAPDNLLKFMIEEGDMVTVDNDRVLHGREKFQTDGSKERALHGAYFDHDEFESRLRILSKQFSKKHN